MRDTRLFIYLKCFKPTELNRLARFMESRIFNTDETLTKLLLYLLPFFKGDDTQQINKNSIWKHLNGRKTYSDLEFRRITSDLVLKIESYLAFEQYRRNPVNEMSYLMTALNEKKLHEPFEAVNKYSRKLLDKNKLHDADFYFQSFRIETEVQRAPGKSKSAERAEKPFPGHAGAGCLLSYQ